MTALNAYAGTISEARNWAKAGGLGGCTYIKQGPATADALAEALTGREGAAERLLRYVQQGGLRQAITPRVLTHDGGPPGANAPRMRPIRPDDSKRLADLVHLAESLPTSPEHPACPEATGARQPRAREGSGSSRQGGLPTA
jgi:hypothetical protein